MASSAAAKRLATALHQHWGSDLLRCPEAAAAIVRDGAEIGSDFEAVDRQLDRAAERLAVSIEDTRDSAKGARLYTSQRGFVLRISRAVPTTTYRYMLAHELAHVLTYDAARRPPRRLVENSAAEEDFCWRVAVELLVPPAARKRVGALLTDPRSFGSQLENTASTFGVAPWLIVKSLILDRIAEGFVAVIWKLVAPKEAEVGDVAKPHGLYLPRRLRSCEGGRRNQLIWRAWAAATPLCEADSVSLGSVRGERHCTAIRVSTPWNGVIELVRTDDTDERRADRWRARSRRELAAHTA